jgi:hypothetical protein
MLAIAAVQLQRFTAEQEFNPFFNKDKQLNY